MQKKRQPPMSPYLKKRFEDLMSELPQMREALSGARAVLKGKQPKPKAKKPRRKPTQCQTNTTTESTGPLTC